MGHLSRADRAQVAQELVESGISQRQVHEMTGVSRDTIRKHGALREQNE